MKNYYEFTKLNEEEVFQDLNSQSDEFFKNILDDYFNYIENNINNHINIFKIIFNRKDYDEFYYSCLFVCKELNKIKILFNILKNKSYNE